MRAIASLHPVHSSILLADVPAGQAGGGHGTRRAEQPQFGDGLPGRASVISSSMPGSGPRLTPAAVSDLSTWLIRLCKAGRPDAPAVAVAALTSSSAGAVVAAVVVASVSADVRDLVSATAAPVS